MERRLESRLLTAIAPAQSVPRPAHDHILLDPWLGTSALQKAIRRGQRIDALLAASLLLDMQPDRLWRRLVVIAMEDIGIADIDLVAETLWVSGKRVWRDEHGGQWAVTASIVGRMCQTVKCRDACDLLVIADLHPNFEDHRVELAAMPEHGLADTLVDHRQPLATRILAAWFMAGTATYPAANLPPRAGRFKLLAEVYEHMGVPPELLQVVSWGASKTREGHAITLPLTWIASTASLWHEVQDEAPGEGVRIVGWPCPAFDMHTRPGKRAIAYFIKACAPMRDFLTRFVPEEEVFELVCSLVFRVEGGLVDRRLAYEGSADILRRADEAMLTFRTFPAGAVPEALHLMRRHLGDLHRARSRIAETYRP